VHRLRIIILGAAAGGGLPQWNCGCENCNAARRGDIPPLTQSSLAVSVDGTSWAILNASPDIGEQMRRTPALHPTGARRSPLAVVLLTNGDLDHIAGLLTLREKQVFDLMATREILDMLAGNRVFDGLDPACVRRVPVALEQPFTLLPGLTATLFAVPGKVPLFLESGTVATDLEGEQTVGVELRGGGTRACYVPGCARMTPALAQRLRGADSDDEMIRLNLGTKTGTRMGHMPMSGPDGSIAACTSLGIERRVFVHMNNSNPVLRPDTPEREAAEAAGWIIGQDGMEIGA
jgi:pyrroloquinoline quinone biosynthesis protein B